MSHCKPTHSWKKMCSVSYFAQCKSVSDINCICYTEKDLQGVPDTQRYFSTCQMMYFFPLSFKNYFLPSFALWCWAPARPPASTTNRLGIKKLMDGYSDPVAGLMALHFWYGSYGSRPWKILSCAACFSTDKSSAWTIMDFFNTSI